MLYEVITIGIIIGGAFGPIVGSMVNDIIMPPIGMALGNVDFSNLFIMVKAGSKAAAPYASLADAVITSYSYSIHYTKLYDTIFASVSISEG